MSAGKWSLKMDVKGFVGRRMQVVNRELSRAGQNIVTDVRHRMQAPKTGRSYISRAAKLTRVFESSSLKTRSPVFRDASGKKVGKGKHVINLNFKEGKIGRHYAGTRHIASRKGEAPAVDTGELVKHVGYALKPGPLQSTVVVGVIAANGGDSKLLARAIHLEGTMKRPAFGPALATEKRLIVKRMFAALRSVKGPLSLAGTG